MAEVAPQNQITWKGKSEEVKRQVMSYLLFLLCAVDCLFSDGSNI